jgi:hypothetical protein
LWPRETYSIGAGTAGSDFVDGIKPGPWSVAFYDIIKETWVARYVIDFSDSVGANRRIHRINGTALALTTLIHVYSIFAPVIFHGYSAEVNVGDFEWPLSERGHADFRDVNPETKPSGLCVQQVISTFFFFLLQHATRPRFL